MGRESHSGRFLHNDHLIFHMFGTCYISRGNLNITPRVVGNCADVVWGGLGGMLWGGKGGGDQIGVAAQILIVYRVDGMDLIPVYSNFVVEQMSLT